MPEKVLECIPHMVLRTDLQGRILYANRKWEKESGLSFEESKKKGWLATVHPEDAPAMQSTWFASLSRRVPFSVEYRLRTHGEFRWHQISSSFSDHKGVPICLIIFTDNHDYLESVRREEILTRRVRHSAEPIMTVDAANGKVVTFNLAAEKQFQYTQTEIIGKSYTLVIPETSVGQTPHNAPCGTLAAFANLPELEGDMVAIGTSRQVHAKKKNGEEVPITLLVDSYDKSGRSLYIVVMRIISPELNMQKELQRSKNAFLGIISHELRTPLFGLLGTLSMLPPMQDSALQEEMRNMESCVLNLLSVVNNMIDFYLLEHLHVKPVLAPFRPKVLVADACAKLRSFIRTGVDFTLNVDEQVPPVLVGDPNFIEHILANLVSNAMRYTHLGHVKTEVNLLDPLDPLYQRIRVNSGQVVLQMTIADSGIGIEPEFYSRMFEPFSQVDESDSRRYGGAGLGLAVSKCLAEMLGGIIICKSIVGQGTEFTVLLPLESVENPYPSSVGSSTTMEDSLVIDLEEQTSPSLPAIPAVTRPPVVPNLNLSSLEAALPPPSSPPAPLPSPCKVLKGSPLEIDAECPPSVCMSCPHEHLFAPETSPRGESISPPSSPPRSCSKGCGGDKPCPSASPAVDSIVGAPLFRPISCPYTSLDTPDNVQALPPCPYRFKFKKTTRRFSRSSTGSSSSTTTPRAQSTSPPSSPTPSLSPRSSSPALSLSPYSSPATSPLATSPAPSPNPRSPARAPSPAPIEASETPTLIPTPKLSVIAEHNPDADGPASPLPRHLFSKTCSSSSIEPPPPNRPVIRSRANSTGSLLPDSPPIEIVPLNLRVLVVEDNAMNQMVLKKMLSRAGCEFSVANNGKEALDILYNRDCSTFVGAEKFNVVLMDCQMPVMDGYDATKKIRENEKGGASHLKVFALTATSSSENEKRCYQSGMDGFIAKPVTLKGLYQYLTA